MAKRSEGAAAAAAGWEGLPTDLLERICLRLDVVDVCRIRAVCRDWALFLRSATFIENYAARASPPGSCERWIVVYTDEMYAFVKGRRWIAVSSQKQRRIPQRHEEEYQADCVADGGMVCVSRRSLINNNLVREVFVYNPVAKMRLDLPRIGNSDEYLQWPRWRPWALCAGAGRAFKVVFLRYKSSKMHLYDSDTGAWINRRMPEAMIHETIEKDDFSQTATCIAGVAYCVNWNRSAVLTYNIQNDVWSKIDTPLTRHSRNYLLIEPQIVKGSKQQPVLVAGVRMRRNARINPGWWRREGDDQADVVSIWELETASMTWTKVCEKSCELTSYTFAGNDQQIFVIPHGSGEVMAYDIASRTWQRRPSIPSHKCFSMATFSLEARF